jgi:phospholipid transport system transporter-binding protein
MSEMISCSGDRCTLQGPVTIASVQTLLEEGARSITAAEVMIDLTGVTEVDSTAVSLLLEWRRQAAAASRVIRYVNLPANLVSLAELYGVTDLLGEGRGKKSEG